MKYIKGCVKRPLWRSVHGECHIQARASRAARHGHRRLPCGRHCAPGRLAATCHCRAAAARPHTPRARWPPATQGEQSACISMYIHILEGGRHHFFV